MLQVYYWMILKIVKSHSDHIVTDSVDADVVDNLENDVSSNLETDKKEKENTDDINNGKKSKTKLVAWGFEEYSSEILKDSPTCTKESLRLALTIMTSTLWISNSIDVKSAFLHLLQLFYKEKK